MEYLLAESNIFCISFRVCHSNEVMTVAMSYKNRSQMAIFPYIYIFPSRKLFPWKYNRSIMAIALENSWNNVLKWSILFLFLFPSQTTGFNSAKKKWSVKFSYFPWKSPEIYNFNKRNIGFELNYHNHTSKQTQFDLKQIKTKPNAKRNINKNHRLNTI